MKMTMKQIGPGMIQQMQSPCEACGAQGQIINEADKCKKCRGKKTTKDKKVIEIQIDKGAPSDFRKVFYGEVCSSVKL